MPHKSRSENSISPYMLGCRISMSHSKRVRDSGSRRKSLFLADPQSDSGPEDEFNPIELVHASPNFALFPWIDLFLQVTPAFSKKRVDHIAAATPNFRSAVHAQAAPPAAFYPSASKQMPTMQPPPSAMRAAAPALAAACSRSRRCARHRRW